MFIHIHILSSDAISTRPSWEKCKNAQNRLTAVRKCNDRERTLQVLGRIAELASFPPETIPRSTDARRRSIPQPAAANASSALSSARCSCSCAGELPLLSLRLLLSLSVARARARDCLKSRGRYLYKRKRRFHGHYLSASEFLLGYRSGPGTHRTIRIYWLLPANIHSRGIARPSPMPNAVVSRNILKRLYCDVN